MYIVTYLDGEFFGRFDSEEDAVLWAEMIDGLFDEES